VPAGIRSITAMVITTPTIAPAKCALTTTPTVSMPTPNRRVNGSSSGP
jgi:hypothetical protein